MSSRMSLRKCTSLLHSLRTFSKCNVPDPCKDLRNLIMDPHCKVAIVTGGASGIGYSVASELLSCGAKAVVIAQKDERRGLEAAEVLCDHFGMCKAIYMPCDVTNAKQFEDVFRNTINQCRRVDILVNNAGILDDKNWCDTIYTNVTGTLRGNLLAQKFMSSCGGAVVNISATAGLAPWPNCPVYSASKHAVITAVRCFGDTFHYGRTKIRVLGLCPGFTNTQLWEDTQRKHLYEEWGKDTAECINNNMQSACMVGKALVHIIKYGKTGTIWVCEKGYLHEAVFPKPEKLFVSEVVT